MKEPHESIMRGLMEQFGEVSDIIFKDYRPQMVSDFEYTAVPMISLIR